MSIKNSSKPSALSCCLRIIVKSQYKHFWAATSSVKSKSLLQTSVIDFKSKSV
jgi:hypothetical protein